MNYPIGITSTVLLLLTALIVTAQPDSVSQDTLTKFSEKQTTVKYAIPDKNDPAEVAYQKRIRKTRIDGVYIPKDLYDTFAQFDRLMGDATRSQFKNLSEEEAGKKFHLILWICNNWGFYEGSRLSHYLREMGIFHPESQAHFLVTTYHRQLNGKSLQLKETAQFYKNKNESAKKQQLEGHEVIDQQTRQRPRGEENH